MVIRRLIVKRLEELEKTKEIEHILEIFRR
jgi:hypothetical protein